MAQAIIYIIALIAIIVILFIIFRSDNNTMGEANNICQYKVHNENHINFYNDHIFENFYLNDNYTDIEIVSHNGKFRAHKVILAAHSKYLNEKITSDSKELNLSHINSKILATLIHFLYKFDIPNDILYNNKDYANLMSAANELQIDWLKCELSKRLSNHINTKNVADILLLADNASADLLKIYASQYLMEHWNVVHKENEWQHTINENAHLLTTAIDLSGNLPKNSFCDIQCEPITFYYDILINLRQFLTEKQYTDAKIIITNDNIQYEIQVNRAILMGQSLTFQKQFQQSSTTYIDHVNLTIAMEFLGYVYSGLITELDPMAEQLLYLSDNFQLNVLKNLCEKLIIDKINIENVSNAVEIADNAHSDTIMSAALSFILNHRNDVVKTKSWITLKQSKPHLLSKIFS